MTTYQRFVITLSFILILIILPFNVFAAEWEIRDFPRKEMPCVDGNCTLLLDTVREFAKYRIYHTFEISGNLIHKIIKIHYYEQPPFKVCINMVSVEEDSPRVFDVYLFKNGEQIAFEPYLDFYGDYGDNKKVANFPCYLAQSNDTILIDYYVGGKIKPVIDEFLFFNITRSEVIYPLDKYILTSWNGLDRVYYNRIDKLILPNSFILIENESEDTCPSAIKFGMFRDRFNETNNETIRQLLANFYIFGDWYVFEGGGKGDFVTEDGKRVIIWPTLNSGPLDYIKSINPWRYNFSVDDWDNIYDGRTGCYLSVKFERTEIIKYFFFVSILLISIASIYFLWLYRNDKINNRSKLYKTFSSSFIIWSFQEGLSSLTPLIRPTIITLFDLTLFIPLIFVIIFYRKPIFYKPIKIVLFYLTGIISKIKNKLKYDAIFIKLKK
jgi:hypothetical protein